MSHLLIDDRGELWRGESRQLREAFDSPFSGGEFVEYAVKNLGFVAINIYGRSLQLRLRPGFVTSRACRALRKWMECAHFDRVVLSIFSSGWQDSLVRRDQIMERVEALASLAGEQRPDDFLARPLTDEAFTNNSLLRDVIENWPNLIANYNADTLLKLACYAVSARYAIIGASNSQGKLVFQEISDQLYTAYDTWRSCAVGAPIEEQPDRAYGRWVAKTYYTALQQSTPMCSAVDAIIHYPDVGRTRRRYQRLIFPVPTSSGSTLLVGGSILDNTIDLRLDSR